MDNYSIMEVLEEVTVACCLFDLPMSSAGCGMEHLIRGTCWRYCAGCVELGGLISIDLEGVSHDSLTRVGHGSFANVADALGGLLIALVRALHPPHALIMFR